MLLPCYIHCIVIYFVITSRLLLNKGLLKTYHFWLFLYFRPHTTFATDCFGSFSIHYNWHWRGTKSHFFLCPSVLSPCNCLSFSLKKCFNVLLTRYFNENWHKCSVWVVTFYVHFFQLTYFWGPIRDILLEKYSENACYFKSFMEKDQVLFQLYTCIVKQYLGITLTSVYSFAITYKNKTN